MHLKITTRARAIYLHVKVSAVVLNPFFWYSFEIKQIGGEVKGAHSIIVLCSILFYFLLLAALAAINLTLITGWVGDWNF